MKNRTVVFVILLLVLALLGGALMMVQMTPPTPDAGGSGDETAATDADLEATAAAGRKKTASKRSKRWRRRGMGWVVARLLEYGSERPVAGVEVTLSAGLPGPNQVLRASTDADGRLRFDDVTNFDEWTLVAAAPDPLAEARLVGVSVTESQETDLGVIYLTPEFNVPGIVLDEAGVAIAGAEVRAVRSQPVEVRTDVFRIVRDLPYPSPAVDTAITDGDGKFVFTKLVPGMYDLEARAPDFQLVVERDVIVTPQAQEREIRIVLPGGFVLHGRVIRTDGGPLEGLQVVSFEWPGDDLAKLQLDKRFASTDEEGEFTLEGLGAGEYMVAAMPEGQPIAVTDRVPIPAKKFVELVIGGDAWLEGTVTGEKNQPLAEADVYVVNFDQRTPTVGHAITDAKGYYRIDGLKSGPVQMLMVQAEGYGAHPPDFLQRLIQQRTQFTLKPGPNRQDINLGKGGIVRGTVIARDEETPIEGVRVALRSPRSFFGGTRSATSDGEGKFEITGVPLGSTVLSAEKEGWFQPGVGPHTIQTLVMRSLQGNAADQGRGSVVTISEPGQVVEREVKLVQGTHLSGKVVSPADEPVSGARVSLEFEPLGNWMDQVNPMFPLGEPRLTGAEGEFSMPAPPPGQAVRLVARAQGYLDGVVGDIKINVGEVKSGMVVKLRHGATLEGKVTATGGKPLSGAQVRYLLTEGDNESSLRWQLRRAEPSNTGDDGTFRITNVETGKLLVQISHPEYLSQSKSGVDAQEGQTVEIDMKLEKAPVLQGKVLGSDGRPFVGARIDYNLRSPRPEGVDSTHANPRNPTTDSRGEFLIEGVIPGKYRLVATAPGAAPSEPVEVETGAPAVTLTLSRAYVIAGHVRSSDGRPLSGIEVDLTGADVRSVRTGPEGEFEIRDVPAGKYQVRAELSGTMHGDTTNVQPKTVPEVEAGTQNLLIELDAGLSIRGTVVDAAGKPVEGGWAWCNRIRTGDEGSDQDVNQWGPIIEGEFTLSGLTEGDYNVGVSAGDQNARYQRAAAGDDDVRFDLGAGGRIRGRVVLPDGKPGAGLNVSANSQDGYSSNAQTDEEGRYEIEGLQAGTYIVSTWTQVEGNWTVTNEEGVVLADGGVEEVELRVVAGE